MVKKASFLQRIRERWGSGSGVRVSPAEARQTGAPHGSSTGGNGNGHGSSQRAQAPVERIPGRDVARPIAQVDARPSGKLNEREEALLALGTHFQELTALVRGSQARTDEQMQRLVAATQALGTLPQAAQQQVELLRTLGSQLEKQNALGEQVATTLQTLPNLLTNVETALARAAATDERTAATVREFHSTMDRIHSSMQQMVQHSEQQAQASQQLASRRTEDLHELSTGIERAQQAAAAELKRSSDESLASLRRTHEDQSNRLHKVVQEQAGWNRAVLVGIGLVVLGIGALIALQLFR
jgi:hypothetical protein